MDGTRREALDRAIAPVLDELLTPALIIDLDAVDHNIAAMVARVGDPGRWRPHLKTSKQAVVIEALLAQGVTHFKVATLDELALALETAGERAIDVVLAHPVTRPGFEVSRVLAAEHGSARVQWLADSPEHLGLLTSWAKTGPVTVALDVDLGMGRTGTPPSEWIAWARATKLGRRVRVTSLHGYDGHLGADEFERAHAGYTQLIELATAGATACVLALDGLDIVTSGTHSYALALAHPGLAHGPWRHQVSPGTIVFSDLRSHQAAADLGLQQAAFVAARVISRAAGRVTLDAGSKSITPDGDPPVCAALDHPELTPMRASEEHLPCALSPGATAPDLGTLVWLIPDHVCTTVNMHREAVWVRGDQLVGRGPVVSGHRCSRPQPIG